MPSLKAKPNDAVAVAFAAGIYDNKPELTIEGVNTCPAVAANPFSSNTPLAGRFTTLIFDRALPASGSTKGKSETENV